MGVILNNLIPIIGSSIAMSIPLVLASVGGAFSVRSGIMALGLESMMMMGAFFGVLGSYFTGSVLFGFLLGMVGGMVIGLFHGILSVRYKVNQVISGIGLNLLALAVTTLLMQLIWNNKGSTPQVASISTTLDFFAPIPVIGPILAQQSVSFLVMVAVVIVGWIVLFKTRFGLRLRACGEHPQAADSVGINVYKMRYAGVIISGALGAIGGMAYIVPPVQTWNFEVGVAGAGFLAMAVMIFGQWKPFNIFGAAMFFAVFKSLANIADSTFLAQLHWSSNIYNMMPFVASMIILAFTSKNSMAPKAEGIPYDKGSR